MGNKDEEQQPLQLHRRSALSGERCSEGLIEVIDTERLLNKTGKPRASESALDVNVAIARHQNHRHGHICPAQFPQCVFSVHHRHRYIKQNRANVRVIHHSPSASLFFRNCASYSASF